LPAAKVGSERRKTWKVVLKPTWVASMTPSRCRGSSYSLGKVRPFSAIDPSLEFAAGIGCPASYAARHPGSFADRLIVTTEIPSLSGRNS
jgi:hypothetical protein